MVRVFAILLATTSLAWSAEPNICRPFATQYTQLVMNYVWLRAYTRCIDSDEVPDLPKNALDALKRSLPDETVVPPPVSLEGTAPATGRPVDATNPPADPVTPTAVSGSPAPAQFCARAHRKIEWHGRSWRCT